MEENKLDLYCHVSSYLKNNVRNIIGPMILNILHLTKGMRASKSSFHQVIPVNRPNKVQYEKLFISIAQHWLIQANQFRRE